MQVLNWKSALSGIPQGSILGFFIILNISMIWTIKKKIVLKFADDTKVFRKILNDGDKQHLQNDLDKLVKSSENWKMVIHFGKCEFLEKRT